MLYENKLKEVLWAKKMDQKDLAAVTGISRTTITQIANHRSEPKISTAYAIAKALEASVYDIWPKPSQD